MVISTIASARCIRAWPLLQRGDEAHLQSCVLSAVVSSEECSAQVLQDTDDCRSRVRVSEGDRDLVPNPASCERRCRRPRG